MRWTSWLSMPATISLLTGFAGGPPPAEEPQLVVDLSIVIDPALGGLPVNASATMDGAYVQLVVTGAVNFTAAGWDRATGSVSAPYFGGRGYAVKACGSVEDSSGVVEEVCEYTSIFTSEVVADHDGDSRSDLSVWRPASGDWYGRQVDDGQGDLLGFSFGRDGDIPVSGDFDGDRRTDVGVYRPQDGTWWILGSEEGLAVSQFGGRDDVPVVADYDGNGTADIAIWRPADGTWWIQLAWNEPPWVFSLGTATDVPVPADFDGDGAANVAIWRPDHATYLIRDNDGALTQRPVGRPGDRPVTGDFNRDGRSDPAVWRPHDGRWIIDTGPGGVVERYLASGTNAKPVPADYDGDGATDIAVFRSDPPGRWSIAYSGGGGTEVTFGLASDIPLPAMSPPS